MVKKCKWCDREINTGVDMYVYMEFNNGIHLGTKLYFCWDCSCEIRVFLDNPPKSRAVITSETLCE